MTGFTARKQRLPTLPKRLMARLEAEGLGTAIDFEFRRDAASIGYPEVLTGSPIDAKNNSRRLILAEEISAIENALNLVVRHITTTTRDSERHWLGGGPESAAIPNFVDLAGGAMALELDRRGLDKASMVVSDYISHSSYYIYEFVGNEHFRLSSIAIDHGMPEWLMPRLFDLWVAGLRRLLGIPSYVEFEVEIAAGRPSAHQRLALRNHLARTDWTSFERALRRQPQGLIGSRQDGATPRTLV